MTYNKFCEYNNLQDLLKVNYGRDIFKGNFQNQLSLPYQTYSLYKFNRRVLRRNTYKINTTKDNDFVKSGQLCNTIFKGNFELYQLKKPGSYEDTKEKKHINIKNNEDVDSFKFDIFDQFMLNELRKKQQLKIRFNLLRCINLAGQTNKAGIKDLMSGYQAISNATSYPVISIGNKGEKDAQDNRTIDDPEARAENTLNPNFFKSYELDAELPNDILFKCTMKNYTKKPTKKLAKYGRGFDDPIIGSAIADIEDRFWSDKREMNNACYHGKKMYIKDEETKAENAKESNVVNRKELKEQEINLNNWNERISMELRAKQPIEYLPIQSERNKTKYGNCESLLEVMTVKQARYFYFNKILGLHQKPIFRFQPKKIMR